MIRVILKLEEPFRTAGIDGLPETETYPIYVAKSFPVKYCGKVITLKKGLNTYPKEFAIWLLKKYPDLTEQEPGKKAASSESDS